MIYHCVTDIDECVADAANCDTNAACTNTVGSFSCACNPGFTGDGVTCAGKIHMAYITSCYLLHCCDTDINECADDLSNNCDINAACTNIPGSFSCACSPGYTGDGVTCNGKEDCDQSFTLFLTIDRNRFG